MLVDRIRAGGICDRVGGDCLRYLKRRWNSNDGKGHKDFEKWGKLGQGMDSLKRGGGGGGRRGKGGRT